MWNVCTSDNGVLISKRLFDKRGMSKEMQGCDACKIMRLDACQVHGYLVRRDIQICDIRPYFNLAEHQMVYRLKQS